MSPRRRFVVAAILCVLGAAFFAPRFARSPASPASRGPIAAPASALIAPLPAAALDPALCTPATLSPADLAAQKLAAQTARRDALAKLAAFDTWFTEFRRADSTLAPSLTASGLTHATARRAALKYLITTDPERALASAFPVGLRAELPAKIAAQLESRLDTRGQLEVSISHAGATARIDRLARLGDTTLHAFVYGRRESQSTKFELPLHGIALDDTFALAASPYRPLDDTEKTARGLAPDALAVLIGDRLTVVSSHAELAALTARLVAAESAPGPHVAQLFSGSPADPATPDIAALTSPPSWITGTKRALLLKIDFSDDTGAAATDTQLQDTGTATADYFAATSQSKTTFAFTLLPTVLRMPKTKAYYEASQSLNNELYVAAHAAAKAYDTTNGGTGAWDPDKFDRYLIVHKRMATYLYGGVAQLGGPRVGLNNGVNLATVGHELGHTQSLAHSHYWLPSGSSPVGAGSHIEYGDLFDMMGGGTLQFNVSQKAKLGYLDSSAITTVTAAGTYRIARHDDKDAAGLRALKIAPADLGYEYWVEHRRNAPTSFNAAQLDRVRNGVLIHWGAEKSPSFTTGQGSYLLDATPGSGGGANDAPLRVGESFVDPDAGITIKPLAVGGTAPNEYVDVQVGFGALDGNRNPVLVADSPTGPLTARTNLVFNASGSDPDGDSVYYRWDFGDSSFQPNLPSITRRFPKGGAYTLRVSAHDGKGGIAVKNVPLTVSDPLTSWTQRTTGLTTNLYGAIYAGGKFVVVGDNGVNLSSPDGVTWTRGTVPSNAHFYRGLAHNGSRFVTVGVAAANAAFRATGAYSDDGLTWTVATMPAGVGTMNAIAYGAGRFVSVGETGRIYNSADGATWSEVTSPVTVALSAVAYADNLFVATGASGRILTSIDGVAWSNRSVATGNTVNSVTRHQGQWYAAVSAFECFASPDGLIWTRIATAGRTNSNNGQRLISAAGVLLSSTLAGGIAFAEDPRTWSAHQLDATANTTFYGLAEGAGQIVMVGVRGLVYSTVSVPAGPVLPAPSLRLDADSIKVAVGKKNILAAYGVGFVKLELYVNGTKVSELAGAAGALTWTPTSIGNYLLTVRGIDATGASVVSATYPAVAAFANWKWLNPGPVGADLRGAVRADGKWWIVGGGGTLLTLDDAGNFAPVDFSTTQQLNAIAYANGRFVIATTDLDGGTKEDIGGLWTSTDGYAWTPFLTGVLDSANLNTVLYAADRWIALGSSGTVVTSTDSINWPRAVSGLTQNIYGAAFGQNLIVAVAAAGKIITSRDGLTWTERTSGLTTDLRAVTFAAGTFVATGLSGVILTSPDGLTWTRRSSGTTTNLYGTAFIKGSFFVGGDNGTLLTSATGATWTAASLNNATSGTLGLAASGDDGLLLGRAGDVYTATTATSWRRLTTGTGEAKQAVLYAGGRWLAVGSNSDPITRATVAPIQTSADGITWTRAAANAAFAPLTAVAYGQQRYVAVGPNTAIFTSPDGATWTQRTLSGFTAAFVAVAAGPAAFVAGSSGSTLFTSPDGTTWTQRTFAPTFPVRGAAYGAGRFVVVGDAGNIRHSTDGTTWTVATSGVTTNLLAVGYWDDVGFLATGASGTILNSTDGLTWQQRESGVAENLAAIARTPLGFVAAGGTQGTLLVSLDAISWSLSALPADKTIRGLAASPTAIVAVGDNGAHLAFELGDTGTPPVIVAQPAPRAGLLGETVRFAVSAQNAAGAVYQWQKDGVPLPGANSPVLTLNAVTSAQAGAYAVKITSAAGTVTSSPATLAFAAIADPGRLINLSIRTDLANAADNFTFGVVVGGAGTLGAKPLLVRAVGPSLAAFGLTGVLDDPKLEFYTGSTKVGENDNWGGAAAIATAMAQLGAFPFAAPASRDAAIFLPSLASGANSAKIFGTGAGTVLAELYDATPAGQFTVATPRLINVSVLKNLGDGVTAGFVLGGSSARTVLIRAIGPTLGTAFGLGGVVADPRLALFSGQTQIGDNDNWGGTTTLATAFTRVGAFALPIDSRDAALLATLQPGAYTVQVIAIGPTGVALVEVYEVP